MKKINRRDFLKVTGATAVTALLPKLPEAPVSMPIEEYANTLDTSPFVLCCYPDPPVSWTSFRPPPEPSKVPAVITNGYGEVFFTEDILADDVVYEQAFNIDPHDVILAGRTPAPVEQYQECVGSMTIKKECQNNTHPN